MASRRSHDCDSVLVSRCFCSDSYQTWIWTSSGVVGKPRLHHAGARITGNKYGVSVLKKNSWKTNGGFSVHFIHVHKRQSHGCFTGSLKPRVQEELQIVSFPPLLCMCRIWSIMWLIFVNNHEKHSLHFQSSRHFVHEPHKPEIHSGCILDTHVWMRQSPVQLNQHETESWSSASQKEIPLDSKPSSQNLGIMFDSHFKLLMSHVGTATKSAFQSSETNWCMPSYPAVTHLKMYVKLGFRAESDLSHCHANDSKSFYLFWSTSWSQYL